jgi:hypothetical protein
MTSAAYKAAGMGRRSAERQGYGLVVFAAILLAVIGCLNLIYGIAAIANSFWVADHHRHRRGRAVGAVRLRQPPEHRSRRLMREAGTPARVGRTHAA